MPVSIWGLVVIVALVALFLPGFARIGNLTNVLRVGAILALASYGQTIVLIAGGIDFSIGSSVALCSVITALAIQQLPLGLALTVGFASIIVVGAINGLLVAYLKLSPFLVTLGMLLLVHGFAAIVAGGLPVELPDREGIHTLSGGSFWAFLTRSSLPAWRPSRFMSCWNERHSAGRGFLSAQACRPPRRPASGSAATSSSLTCWRRRLSEWPV